MKMKCLAVGIILLFVAIAYAPALAQNTEKSSASRGTWLYVGGAGPGNYTTIQSAINDANPGDTVFVYAGNYHENVMVTKTINLFGEDSQTVCINASNLPLSYAVQIANTVNVLVKNFTIKGCVQTWTGSGILISSSTGITIESCNIVDNYDGISLLTTHYSTVRGNYVRCIGYYGAGITLSSSTNNMLELNHIEYCYSGIFSESSNDNTLCNNNVSFSDHVGIHLYTSSKRNTIESNEVYQNERGLAIWSYSENNIIHENNISECLFAAVDVTESNSNHIFNNSLQHNEFGVYLNQFGDFQNKTQIDGNYIFDNDYGIRLGPNSNSNNICYNNITQSHVYGIYGVQTTRNIIYFNTFYSNLDEVLYLVDDSNNNTLFNNNFMNNIRPGYDECTNTWDDGYPIGGNYWSEYTGPDTDGDGIGDIPYNISGGSNQDLYPLMHPFELYYLLNLTLDHPEVYEGGIFNVTVKTIGGTVAPKAHVTFNNHLILTNTTGVAQFTAPFVTEDTIYLIQAIKPGYTSDNTSIIIKNTQQESGRAIIFGRITNVTTAEDSIIFQAVNTRVLIFSPLSFHHYASGEMLEITKEYKGLLLAQFVFILCEIL